MNLIGISMKHGNGNVAIHRLIEIQGICCLIGCMIDTKPQVKEPTLWQVNCFSMQVPGT